MGFAPPQAAPPPVPGGGPAITIGSGANPCGGITSGGGGFLDAGIGEGPPLAELCGFEIPSFLPSIKFGLPSFGLTIPLPAFAFSLALNCSLSNPLDVSGGIGWGGCREPNNDPDPDQQLLEEAA